MYAIVKIGGRQYRVEKGDSIVVDRMPAGEGEKVQLEPLLYRPDGKDDPVFEGAELEKVKVEATVTGHERGPKLRVLKFKPTDFATGLQETYKWYLRHKGAKQDYAFEDMLLTHAPVLPPPKA